MNGSTRECVDSTLTVTHKKVNDDTSWRQKDAPVRALSRSVMDVSMMVPLDADVL